MITILSVIVLIGLLLILIAKFIFHFIEMRKIKQILNRFDEKLDNKLNKINKED